MEVISSLESLVQELKKGLDQASLLEELETCAWTFSAARAGWPNS